jgi:hypothetical protein
VLRISLEQHRSGTNMGENQAFPAHQREELVQQLETLSLKVHIESLCILSNLWYYLCDVCAEDIMCVHEVNDTLQMDPSQALLIIKNQLIAHTKHIIYTHMIFPPTCFGS